MRNAMIGIASLAGLAMLPTASFADEGGAAAGVATGAVAGAIVGGPIGAAVGAGIGGIVGGAASGPEQTYVYVPAEPVPAPTVRERIVTEPAPSVSRRTCWEDEYGAEVCRQVRR